MCIVLLATQSELQYTDCKVSLQRLKRDRRLSVIFTVVRLSPAEHELDYKHITKNNYSLKKYIKKPHLNTTYSHTIFYVYYYFLLLFV